MRRMLLEKRTLIKKVHLHDNIGLTINWVSKARTIMNDFKLFNKYITKITGFFNIILKLYTNIAYLIHKI
jgi:hypothetical protein